MDFIPVTWVLGEGEREVETNLLGIEKEDKESEGSNSLIKQESHSHKRESTVQEKPSRMEVPPARGPQIDGLQWVPSGTAPLPEEDDCDRRREDKDECANQYLPLQPVFHSHSCFTCVGILHFFPLSWLRAQNETKQKTNGFLITTELERVEYHGR